MQGMGNIDIFNNVIANSGDNGFYGSNGTFIYRIPDGYYNIINNTFINSGNNGFAFFNNEGGTKRLINNVFAGTIEDVYRKGAVIDTISNIMTQNIDNLYFKNISKNDYEIGINSIAIDKGADVSNYGIIDDINGNERLGIYDIGAFEYQEVLSILDYDSIDNIEFYPNPVNNNLHISNLKNNKTTISVYTSLGQLIFKNEMNENELDISTIHWSNGLYLLVIDGEIYKIMKNIR